MTILITGAAGFIGYHAADALLSKGQNVVGIDNLNSYYDPALKEARLERLGRYPGFRFERLDLADTPNVLRVVEACRPQAIVHLAAQAGVRYSIEAPFAYAQSNLIGHLSILEAARLLGDDLKHLVYASSSSVYGESARVPFKEDDVSNTPASLYAATKRADELMTASYSSLYGIPATGLRFFTVYGPWGRPDMAYWLFSDAILAGEPIKIFNHGEMRRDFTYIDDVIAPLMHIVDGRPSRGQHDVFNIGGSAPVRLLDMVEQLEAALGHRAEKVMMDMQPGDVTQTYADTSKLQKAYGYEPQVGLGEGLGRFAEWFHAWKAR